MARAARSVHARKKRRKILEQAKGYRGTKKSSYKRAKEQVWKSGVYAYVGRIESQPNLDGRNMVMVMAPRKDVASKGETGRQKSAARG